MDLVDIITEKKFLGQEFLTWLWWKSETSGSVQTGSGPISVSFEKKLTVEDENGKVSCSVPEEFPEAKAGLAAGKKVEQARIRLINDGGEFLFTLTASLFEFKAVKLPKVAPVEDEVQEIEGLILERTFLFQTLRDAVYSLFRSFLEVRVDGDDWYIEAAAVREWVTQQAVI